MAERRRELQIDQRVRPVGPRRDITGPQCGRDRFGIAADLNDAIIAVESGQTRRRRRLEIAVDVVLEDDDIMAFRQLERAMRMRRRQGGAGRVMWPGDGQIKPGAMFREDEFQRREVGTVAQKGREHDFPRCTSSSCTMLK